MWFLTGIWLPPGCLWGWVFTEQSGAATIQLGHVRHASSNPQSQQQGSQQMALSHFATLCSGLCCNQDAQCK